MILYVASLWKNIPITCDMYHNSYVSEIKLCIESPGMIVLHLVYWLPPEKDTHPWLID